METNRVVKVMKALSNKNRFEIFMEIYKTNKQATYEDEECFIYEFMMKKLKIGAPTMSHHLKELANADLIVTEKRGKNIIARINEETVTELGNLLRLE
ncbi:MAG: winged helix-turn-helix transcriptional regulator [Prolixibacteraceae bacterium]|jgi:ArsR family transcriptional regulator, arsenate/arsenite/antimonite-responsive transcriptional repressor|nr:winged helix-turn-helix transcriptional regulator [Prolixibacteraceae bacterium]MBT6765137.1 winged helix-turn-helix transcriptional regulator [Prolixibacteraceae bacterium]MBT7000881.1 winged helix-turn-helix transcriptional regulator [Prolixibacteraceae bacterium]MBT7397160.1 winged helix-turn-helix transcriptional regulator [Prolixibacteraceae bacterium]